MRVLYITHSTDMSAGATKSLLALICGIRPMGIETYVITPDRNGLYEVLERDGVAVAEVEMRMDVYPNLKSIQDAFLFLPRLVCRRWIEKQAENEIYEWCKTWKIDVIHANVSVMSCGLSAARKLRIPHVTHVREFVDRDFGMCPYPTKNSYYERLRLTYVYPVCITKGIRDYHHLYGGNVSQIYNGIDMAVSSKHSEFFHENFFLYAGRIEPSKGVAFMLEAYRIFLKRYPEGYPLRIAGAESDVEYVRGLHQYVSEHHLQDKVMFLGVRSDVSSLMMDAQALIVPSVCEAFGRCLPEAMLNGCVTIGRNTGGTKEQYDNGVDICGSEIGLRFDTVEELAAQMETVFLHHDSKTISRMRSDAKKVVTKLYSVQHYTGNMYALYTRLVRDSDECTA